jgi:hypothetical protein
MARVLVLAVLTVLFAARANAAPITVSAGEFVTFNFDLSGATPAPPYVLASVNLNTSGLDFEPCDSGLCDLLDIGVWKFWTELDGAGSLFFSHDVSLGAKFHTEMHDGVFSATLEMTAGAITVDPVACGIAADGSRTPDCPAAPPPPPVPEPATVGLVALGAGALLARRRRTGAPRRT